MCVRASQLVLRPRHRTQEEGNNAGGGLAGCLFTVGRMNVPLRLLTAAHLFCAAAGALRVSLERQLLEEEISSGRRTCRLYCRVGIGFHLQIHPDGRVNGSHEPNQLSESRNVGTSKLNLNCPWRLSGRASALDRGTGARGREGRSSELGSTWKMCEAMFVMVAGRSNCGSNRCSSEAAR